MILDLRFINRPIEDLWCQAAVLLVFQSPDIENGVLSGINRKMGGSLSDILNAGVWTGERGETFLLATQDAIRSGKLLMRGLGPESSFDSEVLKKESSETGYVLDRMGISEFAVNIPYPDGRKGEYSIYLETAAASLIETFTNKYKNDPDFLLKVFFTIDDELLNAVDPVMRKLGENIGEGPEVSVICDRQPGRDYEEDM